LEATSFQDVGAPIGFHEGEAEEHYHPRTKPQCVADEFFDELERWVRDDGFGTGGRLTLHQKIPPREKIRSAVVDEIRAENLVLGTAQDIYNVAASGGGLPNSPRKVHVAQQSMHGDGGCFVAIVAALGEV